jgi:chemotaxis protein MotB
MSALSEEPASEGAPEWLVTYADMITILMSFFAVMFSLAMSKHAKKDGPLIKSLQRQFGALDASTSPAADQATIGTVLYFDSGESGLNEQQREQLQALAKALGGKPGKIEILARTLGQPQDADDRLGQNWNLARARCDSTLRYLTLSGIDSARIRIGVAARFEPIGAGGSVPRLENNDGVEVFTRSDFAEEARAQPSQRARE